MAKTAELTVQPPAIPALPDTSKLPVVDFTSMLAVKVVDQASAAVAATNVRTAQSFNAAVDAIFEEPTSLANKLHKWFTTMRGSLKAPAEAVILHGKQEQGRWLAEENRKAAALQAQLQRQAEEQARLARQAEIDALDIWDIPAVPEPPPVVPTVVVPQVQPIGFSQAYKPWGFEVKDLMALLKSITTPEVVGPYLKGLKENLAKSKRLTGGMTAEEAAYHDGYEACLQAVIDDLEYTVARGSVPLFDPAGTPILQVYAPFFKAAAKQYEAELSRHYPGVEGVREVTLR
jgi:hypothetical protein